MATCHPILPLVILSASEGSRSLVAEMLRFTQHDNSPPDCPIRFIHTSPTPNSKFQKHIHHPSFMLQWPQQPSLHDEGEQVDTVSVTAMVMLNKSAVGADLSGTSPIYRPSSPRHSTSSASQHRSSPSTEGNP